MSDLHVVLGDLDGLSSRFAQQADAYQALIPKMSPPAADTGNGSVNATVAAVMDMFTLLHPQMVASIESHSKKLHNAREAYNRTEEVNRNRFLYDDLVEGFK